MEWLKTVLIKDDDSSKMEVSYEPYKKLVVEVEGDNLCSYIGDLRTCIDAIKDYLGDGWLIEKTDIEELK